MKKALLSLALSASVLPSQAQGTITFFSLNQIFFYPGYSSSDYTAGLFLASDVNTPIATTDFVPDTGYFNAIEVTVPGFGVGSSPAFVVRAWESGKTYETSGIRNGSVSFTAGPLGGPQLPNPPATPPDLGPNFTGFSIPGLPEPSSYALGIAGLGVLAMMGRRKR